MALLTREMIPDPEQVDASESHVLDIPDGAAGVAATLGLMVQWTKEYRQNLTIRRFAEQIVGMIPQKSYWDEAAAIQQWVRDNIRYTQDVFDVETLRTPLALLQERFGDCDDKTLLAGTLLQSIGHPVRYVAIGDGVSGIYVHVFLETKIGTRWVGMETTEEVPFGWEPEIQSPRMVRNI